MTANSGHTATHPGKRVIVVLRSGEVLLDRFVGRPKHRRWIDLEKAGRIAKSCIKSFSVMKGEFDPKRLGLSPQQE